MNFLKKLMPLAIGVFFLTSNANILNTVNIINQTSQKDMFIYTTYNESNIRIGNSIPVNATRIFNKFQGHIPKFLYIFNHWKISHYNFVERKFHNYIEKINLENIINYFLLNHYQDQQIIDIELTNLKIEIFSTIDNQLIITLKDLN